MGKVEIIKSALKFLVQKQTEQGSWGFSDADDDEISWNEAIEWLKQQPCEDCISREATIDAIYKKHIGGKDAIENAPINDLYACGLEEAIDAVEDMPSVTPQLKRGKWIYDGDCIICNKCLKAFGWISMNMVSNFCPNCGADMREGEE